MKIELSPLTEQHFFDNFDCGENTVNNFLKNESLWEKAENLTNIYIFHKDFEVVAYSALYSCHFRYRNSTLNKEFRYPGICIGQLGVDKRYKGKGLGKLLIQHAISISHSIRNNIGCRIIYVEALKNAKKYWISNNFEEIEPKKKTQFKMVFDININ